MVDTITLYKKEFDAKKYAKDYLSERGYEMKTIVEDFCHRVFTLDKLSGKTLLDVGSGPSVRCAISASANFSEIYLSDLLDSARAEVAKWLRGDPDAIDYTWEFKHVAQLEGHKDYKKLEERVRKAVKGTLPCNILESNPLHPKVETFDVVTTSFCLDVLTTMTEYVQALKNVISLVREDGHLILLGVIGGKMYKVGGTKFPIAFVEPTVIRKSVEDAGLKILEYSERFYKEGKQIEFDERGLYTIFAQKIRQ